jgi:LysM repeat protein
VIPWWHDFDPDGQVDNEPDEDATPPEPPSPIDLTPEWTVASGDTLSRISQKTGVPLATILRCNPEIKNPNQIRVGQTIRLA